MYHCTITKIDLTFLVSIILYYILYYNIIYNINISYNLYRNYKLIKYQMVQWYIGTLVQSAAHPHGVLQPVRNI